MGAWGANSFQNDWALDWVGDLFESGDVSLIRKTLSQVLAHDGLRRNYFLGICIKKRKELLPASLASRALAAIELVTACYGYPPDSLPDGAGEWLQLRASPLDRGIVRIAQDALCKIKNSSELKDFWDEGGANHASRWYDAVEDLECRLEKAANGSPR
jgi:hypothetical protein